MNLITRLPTIVWRNTLGRLRGPSSARGAGRDGAWFRRLQRALLVGTLVVVVIGLGVAWSLLQKREFLEAQEKQLTEALKHLDAGDFEGARRIASQLRVSRLSFKRMGGPVFVLGAALTHDALEQSDPVEQQKLYLIASRYLEEARDRSFPPGREPVGKLMLGTTMFHAGRYAECIPVLKECLKLHPAQQTLIHRYLAEAYERDLSRQYDHSLEHIDNYLRDKVLPTVSRLEGEVLRARVALHRARQVPNDPEQFQHYMSICQKALDAIAELDPFKAESEGEIEETTNKEDRHAKARIRELVNEGVVLQAQMLLHQVALLHQPFSTEQQQAEMQALLDRARNHLQELEKRGHSTAPADYLLGHTLRKLYELADMRGDQQAARDNLLAALNQFAHTVLRNYATPEGFAAELEQAEVQRLLEQYDESLVTYINVLHDAGDPAQLVNPWIDELDTTKNNDEVDELRRRITAAYSSAIEDKRFEHAESLAEHLKPLFSADHALEMQAETQAAWAEHLLRTSDELPASLRRTQQQQASDRFRQAGESFRKLAELRFITREYSDILWKSADSFLRGNSYRPAAEMIEKYLDEEPRRRRPRALTMLGDAQLGLNDLKEASETYLHCLAAYPKDPDANRARLGAAQTNLELGKLDEAVGLLRENLEGASLTPQSVDWRDSLFLLAETQYRQGLEMLTRSRESRDAKALDEQTRKNVQRQLDEAASGLGSAALRFKEAIQRYPDDPRVYKASYFLAEAHRHRAKIPRWKLPLETVEARRAELSRSMHAELETALKEYDILLRKLEVKQETRDELTPLELVIQRNCYFAKAHTLFDLERYAPDAVDAYETATNRYQSEPASLEAYQQIAACYRKLGNPTKARGYIEQAKMVLANMPADKDYQRTTRYSREVWLDLLK